MCYFYFYGNKIQYAEIGWCAIFTFMVIKYNMQKLYPYYKDMKWIKKRKKKEN